MYGIEWNVIVSCLFKVREKYEVDFTERCCCNDENMYIVVVLCIVGTLRARFREGIRELWCILYENVV